MHNAGEKKETSVKNSAQLFLTEAFGFVRCRLYESASRCTASENISARRNLFS